MKFKEVNSDDFGIKRKVMVERYEENDIFIHLKDFGIQINPKHKTFAVFEYAE